MQRTDLALLKAISRGHRLVRRTRIRTCGQTLQRLARMGAHRWIIDPLDGTTNFAHGFPQFCVSIAYKRRGRLELAVVFDVLKRELFVAAHGRGARLNGRPIHVSTTPSLDRALLATAFPAGAAQFLTSGR